MKTQENAKPSMTDKATGLYDVVVVACRIFSAGTYLRRKEVDEV